MALPLSFLAGLFCLFAAAELGLDLPHHVDFGAVSPYLALVFAPWGVVCLMTSRGVVRDDGRVLRRGFVRGFLQSASIPFAYWLLLVPGEWSLWVDQAASPVLVVAILAKLAPLVAMETLVHFARDRASRRAPAAGFGPAPFHLTMVVFLSILLVMFAGVVDLMGLHRDVAVFTLHTALGNQFWLLGFVVALCAVLPFLFRVLSQPSTEVPRDSLDTASALGFPRRNVQLLRTGNRMINAMLVGPVPGLRYLFLTDGLVAVLDPLSLRGVVAHEVGHARANHPLLLVLALGVLPLLLLYPLDVLGLTELGPWGLTVAAVVAAVAGVRVVRRIAHRFELEADLLSADALGGAGPCILALHKVSEIAGGRPDRATLRHPSEESRILHLLSCEGDPWFRERFDRRGRVLRRGLVAALAVALGLSVWSHTRLWPVDKLIFQYLTGRFALAQATLERIPAVLPPGRNRLVAQLRQELAAARSLQPDGGAWREIRDDLAAAALRQGRRELLRNGPRAARPWYSVAMAKPSPTPLELSLHLYCEAMADEDGARATELRAHILRTFDPDPEMKRALAADQ